ncbi:MAG: hypothetical protein ICV77_09750 [Cyanobacteria bacterium Co-bin8]|nr:hypothetical protein [Cyanobacteria bacterium Co-bin8]
MADLHSVVYGILGGLLTVVGTTIGVSNYLNNRFSIAESKLSNLSQQLSLDLERLRSDLGTTGAREMSHWEMAEYQINDCRNLVNHRTQRFKECLEQVEKRLTDDINEVKNYLAKTTSFEIRDRQL